MYCEKCDKLGWEWCHCKKDALVQQLVDGHADTWQDKPDWFWFLSLLEEVGELGMALLGLHEHAPEFELAQIASIAINWRNRIN